MKRDANIRIAARDVCVVALMLFCLILVSARECSAYCLECHHRDSGSVVWKSIHAPYKEECLLCHEEHLGRGEPLMTAEGNDLCRQCHEIDHPYLKTRHQQMPVEKLSCLNCHDPHRSEKVKLLNSSIHRPLAYGECQDCHLEGGGLRAKTPTLLCYQCHDRKSFDGASVHEPVRTGECMDCHDPHGTRYDALSKYAYTRDRFIPFGEKAYELCFSCHESSSFAVEGPEADTGFRDKYDNYHNLHVVKRKINVTGNVIKEGNACRNCHLPHSSPRLHLIREELDCGGGVLCLKLEYSIQEGVATCTAGCHKPISYSSGTPGEAFLDTMSRIPAPQEDLSELLKPAPESVCLECHQDSWKKFQKQHIHDPVAKKRCQDCHINHGKDNKLILVAYEDRLCARCHEKKTSGFDQAHGDIDVTGSSCIKCHDPHASERETLLYATSHDPYKERLCDVCHDSTEGRWATSRPANEICKDCHDEQFDHLYVHSAIAEASCIGCHDPHASQSDNLLLVGIPNLCYRCHKQETYQRALRHEPLEDGNCGECHDVHGTDYPTILLSSYPMERYQDFHPEQYALCFSCHDIDPFLKMDSTDTRFRNGGVNLHYLHANTREVKSIVGKKVILGYTCRNCHNPHSTDQALLIRETLDCEGVPCLSLEFKKIGESGRCSRGCHTPKIYSP